MSSQSSTRPKMADGIKFQMLDLRLLAVDTKLYIGLGKTKSAPLFTSLSLLGAQTRTKA